MFQLNGKTLLECNEDDIQLLIDDPAFRENENIDYKKNFAFLEIDDKNDKNAKKVEFRNDVCSFANAEGGYLLYGVDENKGSAGEIVGIDIQNDNTDKFELDRRNDLQPIFPRVPNIKFHFIHLRTGKYVVVIYIKHDNFAPYTQIENHVNYKFFKRAGNEKVTMTYTEIRSMFNQSLSLDKEILLFRKERINYYSSLQGRIEEMYSQFLLFHIIPDTFLEHDYDQDMFVLQKTKRLSFNSIFTGFRCDENSIPCANGIRFIPNYKTDIQAQCYLYNNGVVECFLSLENEINNRSNCPKGYLAKDYIWDMIKQTWNNYSLQKGLLKNYDRVFLCLDIVGCKGVVSQTPSESRDRHYSGTIDRNTLICDPVVISDIKDETMLENTIKKLHLNYLLSIGVNNCKTIDKLITELYP